MKKILLVTRPICPPWDEASKNFAYYLAKNLNMFEMYILTNGFIQELPSHIHQKPIYTSSKLTHLQRLRLLKLRGLLAKIDFNILHYMLTPSKLNSFSFKTFIKNKRAKTIQTIATLREDILKDNDFKKILFADLIITYSDYAKNKLNSLGFKNVKRVYPGIDVELYSPAEKDKEIQRLLNVTDEDFVISYPGEFSRLGATDDLVSLIINHAKEFRERKIKLCFPGRIKNSADLNKKNEIKKILQSKDMLGVVRFTDELTVKIIPSDDFMKRKYNTSDLIIFPVRSMQGKFDVPLAVIEAMACGKPVIISNLPILNEFAKENVAVRIEPGNPEILWNAIMDLYSSPEKRNQIGAEARKFVEANFDIKKIADIYQKIYAVL